MTRSKQNRYKSGQGGGRYAALAIIALVLLAVGGYFIFGGGRKSDKPKPSPAVRQTAPPVVLPQQTLPVPDALPGKQSPDYPAESVPPAITVPAPADKLAGKGMLAIIIDDMGASINEARALADIGVPLTFSIIPGLRSYREVGVFAAAKGIETMLHIPMQSKEWPKRRLEKNGLLVSMTDEEIRGHLEEYLRDIPKAAGANNHMGSEFTEHEDKMKSVLAALKGRGLYFVDSVTSARSVGYSLAAGMGMKSGRRNVFLDNEQNSAYILGQLDQAVRLARKNGGAIAICHPHPATIKTLASALPGLKERGITLVPASMLVK